MLAANVVQPHPKLIDRTNYIMLQLDRIDTDAAKITVADAENVFDWTSTTATDQDAYVLYSDTTPVNSVKIYCIWPVKWAARYWEVHVWLVAD